MAPRITEEWHTDAEGNKDPKRFVERKYYHPKTGHLYEVTGFRVDSERGLWLLDYRRVGWVSDGEVNAFSHTIADFTRPGRFLEVKE